MPSPQRTARAPRCQVYENNRRCTRDGHGEPAVCARHRAAIAGAAKASPFATIVAEQVENFLGGKPINREAIFGGIAETLAQQWAPAMGGGYHPEVGRQESENSAHRRAQSGRAAQGVNWSDIFRDAQERVRDAQRQARQAPPPQVDDSERIARDIALARQVMGFAASEPLTEEVITARKRALAKKHHPDRGGSVEKMATINNAADVLMASL